MLGGLSPLIVFTFYREVALPAGLQGAVQPLRFPIVPIPVYLDERITHVQLDDYNRDITIDVMRDGVSAFERVSGDVVNLKFRMKKDNVAITALTALIDRIIETFDKKISPAFDVTNYSMTIFYDNIFVLDASLERFNSTLIEGTDLREISFTFSRRSAKSTAPVSEPIARTVGTSTTIGG